MASFEERKQAFLDFVDSVEGYEMVDEGQFKNATTKVDMRHVECGNIWPIVPDAFKNKSARCNQCSKKRVGAANKARKGKPTTQWSVEKIQDWLDKNRPGWQITGCYKNANTPTEFICSEGHEIEKRWNDIKDKGANCGTCFQQAQTKTQKEFDKEVFDLTNGEYYPVGEYKGNKVKIDILHTKCMEIYSVRPDSFLTNGSRCCCETGSYGEGFMSALLKENNVEFIEQKTYEDLKDKGLLRFDFYLPEFDTVLEIQGEQHYKVVEYFGGEEKFKDQQRKDQMKRDYCKANGIKLIELKYIVKRDVDGFKSVLEEEGILNA